jgi:5'(3')-deoxyribonucleotidase
VRKIQIVLDCDGVLSDFTSGALRIVEEVTGRRFTLSDVTAFDFVKSLGLTVAEGSAVKKLIGSRQGFAAALVPYPGARQGVRRLRELGDVFCVTTPWDSNSWWRDERTSWLALHFGINRVHHEIDKAPFEADVFVDDKASHVQAWSERWPDRTAVFWRTPHNIPEDAPKGAHTTSSWDDLYQIALEAARGPRQGEFDLVSPALEGGAL